MCSNKLQNQITSLSAQIDRLCRRIEEMEIAERDPKPLLIEYSSLLQQRAQLQKQIESEADRAELPLGFQSIKNVLKEMGNARTA